jgi:hypothetical protein
MALGYWGKSNYFAPLIWEGQLVSDISTILGDLEASQILQYLENIQLGVTMNYSRKEINRMEKLIRQLGISKKLRLSAQGMPYGHIDFESGGLIFLP